MSDEQVRAELERIGSTYSAWWDLLKENDDLSSEEGEMLRLLAELHAALGEIADQHHLDDCEPFYGGCACAERIARTARKGGYEGPQIERILPVSLKCKCGYVLKPQDKSCPQCKKLFGEKGGSDASKTVQR